MLAGRLSGSGCSIAWSSGRIDRSTIGEIRNDAALFDDLDLGAAHVDRLAAQRLGQHQSETVDIRLEGDVAAGQTELLGRNIIVFAGEPGADDRPLADAQRTGDAEVDDLGPVARRRPAR